MRCEWQRRAAGTGHTAPAGWGWRECAEPPATEACALAEFSDTVLLFGGYSEAAEEDDDQAQEGEPEEDEDKMLCFAAGVASGKWWRGRLEMPQLEGLTAGGVPAARWAQGPAAGGRCAVLFGGQDTDLSARSDLWLVTLAGSGAPVVSALQPSGGVPQPRSRHAACARADGSCLWVFGGADDDNRALGDLHRLDAPAGGAPRWHRLADGPAPRFNSSLAATQEGLCLYGGARIEEGDQRSLGDLWVYNTEAALWRTVDISGPRPPPRNGHLGFCLPPPTGSTGGDVLVIFGGAAGAASGGGESGSYDERVQLLRIPTADGDQTASGSLVPATGTPPDGGRYMPGWCVREQPEGAPSVQLYLVGGNRRNPGSGELHVLTVA
eukprot:TRINITY_DN36843_c0_g1_i1.p1 TRINITY_DN36843_c0_g1~~TRINITY_DN36843_c0_g1_i1.p1  ORF type:complete len:401 (+),score=85.20 TRINITY_DN36843_c0_g1_i1:62-1204(+)